MSSTYIQGVVLRQVCVSNKAPRTEHLGPVKYGADRVKRVHREKCRAMDWIGSKNAPGIHGEAQGGTEETVYAKPM